MRIIEMTDEMYQRIEAFTQVARAVLDEDVDTVDCFGIVVELGLGAGLNRVIDQQDESTLVQAIQQMAEKDPKLVYGHVADMVALGADIRALRDRQRRIGFHRPS